MDLSGLNMGRGPELHSPNKTTYGNAKWERRKCPHVLPRGIAQNSPTSQFILNSFWISGFSNRDVYYSDGSKIDYSTALVAG